MTVAKTAKASVFIGQDDAAWLTVETPSEVIALMAAAELDDMIELTLGNDSVWNGRPLYLRNRSIAAVGPPKDQGSAIDTDEEA